MLADLVESMKKAALEAVKNSDPTCILYGKVISASPLQIQVNTKLILEASQIVLSKRVTNHTIPTSGSTGSKDGHSHGIGSLTMNNALKAGDEVIMIRQAGGQEFIVLDRVG